MSEHPPDDICLDSAAFVLGALPTTDRLAYESHLVDCEQCRREVAELAGVLPVLQQTPVDQEMLGSAEATVVPLRRKRRGLVIGAGALLAAAAVFLAVAIPTGLFDSPPAEQAISRTFADTGENTIQVRIARASSGSAVEVHCSIRKVGEYQDKNTPVRIVSLWFRSDVAPDVFVTSWPAEPGDMVLPANVPVPPEHITVMELRDADGTVLNTLPV